MIFPSFQNDVYERVLRSLPTQATRTRLGIKYRMTKDRAKEVALLIVYGDAAAMLHRLHAEGYVPSAAADLLLMRRREGQIYE